MWFTCIKVSLLFQGGIRLWFTCIKVSSLFPLGYQDVVHMYKSQFTFSKGMSGCGSHVSYSVHFFQRGIRMWFTCIKVSSLFPRGCQDVIHMYKSQCTFFKVFQVGIGMCFTCLTVSLLLPRPVSGSVSRVLWSVYISQGQCLEVFQMSYGQCTSPEASVRKCFTCLMVSVHLPRPVSGSVSHVLLSVYAFYHSRFKNFWTWCQSRCRSHRLGASLTGHS